MMCWVLPAYAEAVLHHELGLTDKEEATVAAGGMVVHTSSVGDGYVKEAHAFLLIKAPANLILDVITDYKHLPEFMPNLERTEVLFQNEKGARVNYVLNLPFGVSKRYRLQLTHDYTPPELKLSWHNVVWEGLEPDETLKNTSGYWSLQQVPPNKTLLHYYTKTDPGHVPFGLGWVVDYLTHETIVEMLENTKDRSELKWQKRQH